VAVIFHPDGVAGLSTTFQDFCYKSCGMAVNIKFISMKTWLATFHDESGAVPGRKPVLVRPMRLLWAAMLVLPAFGAQAGAVLTTLHSFTGGNDGGFPSATLVQGSDGSFYGTTYYGGLTNYNAYFATFGYGAVFKIGATGALTTLYSFSGGNDGDEPVSLAQGSDGNFYGTTGGGGTNGGFGTVFKIGTNGMLTSLYSFTGGNDGAYPSAGLVQGGDGNFYGMTKSGGLTNYNPQVEMATAPRSPHTCSHSTAPYQPRHRRVWTSSLSGRLPYPR
jgi:uncharacterized repeat protein (TIGR03803 family)